MALITYDDKVALNENPNIADINKVKADDMNEIKSVVNGLIVNSSSNSTTNTYSCDYINPHVLYNNTSGTTADIVLSDNCNNYSYIEIFYGGGDGDIKSTRTLPGSRVLLFTVDMRSSSSAVVIRGANKLVSGTSLSNTVYSGAVDYGQWVSNGGFSKTNYIKIYKVIGYK